MNTPSVYKRAYSKTTLLLKVTGVKRQIKSIRKLFLQACLYDGQDQGNVILVLVFSPSTLLIHVILYLISSSIWLSKETSFRGVVSALTVEQIAVCVVPFSLIIPFIKCRSGRPPMVLTCR